jgi:hypothetical protein
MKRNLITSALMSMFAPNIIQNTLPATIDGAILSASATGVDLTQIANNGQSAAGGVNFITSAAATALLTGLGNFLYRFTLGGAVTVTLDSAYNIANQLPQPLSVGEKFTFNIMTNAATTIATPTLSDTAVTLSGTTTMVAAALRWYQGVVTQVTSATSSIFTAGTTFTSLTQVGTTNNFTVALGTNAIVPVVGNLIYLQVTAGTLPSGWYPINLVTSAVSFVIATPPGTVWTATAATVGVVGVTVIPVTTIPGSTGTLLQAPPATYSPLITITGLMTTVTATMAV